MQNDKIIVFDMDGTLFDFYGVPEWQYYLDTLQDVTPYRIAKPFYDKNMLNPLLHILKQQGWTIAVNSWLSRTKTEKFHNEIKDIKLARLHEIEFPYDMVTFTDYGVNKQSSIPAQFSVQVLVDDNDSIREDWKGITIDAKQNILPKLQGLIAEPEFAKY